MTRHQLGLLAGLLLLVVVNAQKFEGEPCSMGTHSFGECKRIASCDTARLDIQNGKRPSICSYDRDVPIVCCADPNILSAPETSGPATLWPSEGVATPGPTQRPVQRPTQRPTQRPVQRPTQRPAQRPAQGPTQRPAQGPTQRPAQGPTQRPAQRPPSPPPAPALVAQGPPLTSGPPAQPTKRPLWWQIPTRKRTESPAVIDNPATTPISGGS